MKARGVFAKAVDLKQSEMKSGEQQVGIFKVQQRHANEIIIGEDDSHLNFRITVLRAGETNGKRRTNGQSLHRSRNVQRARAGI